MPMKNPHKYNTRIGSAKQHQFSEVPHADIQRSTFDRSHVHCSFLFFVFFELYHMLMCFCNTCRFFRC